MKRWIDLSDPKPWSGRVKNKKIDPNEYMPDGWDSQTPVEYVKGSRHNQIGMWIMWTYYVLIVGMVIRLIWVLNT